MADIIAYKPGAFCQLKLASRERVLISIAQTGIKIMKLSLGGLIPTKTIADWPVSELELVIRIFADETDPSQHPLDAIKNKLIACPSINDIEKMCSGK